MARGLARFCRWASFGSLTDDWRAESGDLSSPSSLLSQRLGFEGAKEEPRECSTVRGLLEQSCERSETSERGR